MYLEYSERKLNKQMRELSDQKLLKKCKALYASILELKKLCVGDNYCANLIDWFIEVVNKNIAINKSIANGRNQEKYKKQRQHVYWINFGRGIGTEFQDYHYALVIYEAEYTALVVPLTSKKEHDPKWIESNKNAIVDLGIVDGYPDNSKECYACTFMLQSVSKKRLDRCGNKQDGYFDLRVSDEQMERVCTKIQKITYNNVKYIDKC